MKKRFLYLSIIATIVFSLIGCSNEAPKEFNLDQLTRVDIQKSTTGENNELIISEEEEIKELKNIFKMIEWDSTENNMSQKEDIKVILYFTFDKNMPEKTLEYSIWFDEENRTTTIIDKEKNIYGKLNKENTKTFNKILLTVN